MNFIWCLVSCILVLLTKTIAFSPGLRKDDDIHRVSQLKKRNHEVCDYFQAAWICARTCFCKQSTGCYSCCPCNGCFPSEAKVQLQNGKSVTMSELETGDLVQTVSSGGKLQYSEVRTFLQRVDSVTAIFRSITTSRNNTIVLSGSHMIYARKNCYDQFTPMYADEISISDDVLVANNNKIAQEKVIHVSSLRKQGVFDPQTVDGTVVVDGVLASCYASFNHDLAHLMMTPMQWYPEIIEWIVGTNDDHPAYVGIAKEFGRWMLPFESLYGRSN